ncbi:MAG: N-acetylmuramoyl-L-alanine amidase [Gemmatimonadetes bacterium]|nr:N-acetylmuramoyl-L-alanine amidase [Gemmatimonadota bacterium]
MWLSLALLASLLQPGRLVVRDGELSTPIPLLETQRGPMIRLEEGLQAIGGALVRMGGDRYRWVVGGADIELTIGIAVAKVRGKSEPLTAPPTVFDGKLLAPLALITDLLPRVAVGYRFDAARSELRRVALPTGPAPVATRRAPEPERPVPARPRQPVPRVVVVDAGHGGPDRGMSGPIGGGVRIYEKNITLGVAREVASALERLGVKVIMTRTRDTLIALADRGRIANEAKASVFLSIHVNAANPRWQNPGGARGFETYFLSEAKTDDERRVEQIENEAVKYEGEQEIDANDPLLFILNDMKQNEFLRESGDLAADVQASLARVHPGPSRGVKQAGFRVLVRAFMPAVLIEVGFGSNRAESSWLASTNGQRELGSAIATATVEYLDRLERKGNTGGGS